MTRFGLLAAPASAEDVAPARRELGYAAALPVRSSITDFRPWLRVGVAG